MLNKTRLCIQATLFLSLPPVMDLVQFHILANENRATECTGVSGPLQDYTSRYNCILGQLSFPLLEERLWDFRTGYPSLCPLQQRTWFLLPQPHQRLLAVYRMTAFLTGMKWSLKVVFTFVWGSCLLSTLFPIDFRAQPLLFVCMPTYWLNCS